MASVEHVLTFPPLDSPVDERRALFERLRIAGVRMGTTTVNLENSVLVPYDTALTRLQSDPLKRYVSRYLAADWAEQVEEKKGPDAARGLESYLKALPAAFRDFREMHAAGVKFLAGSDAAVVFIHPGVSLHGEAREPGPQRRAHAGPSAANGNHQPCGILRSRASAWRRPPGLPGRSCPA